MFPEARIPYTQTKLSAKFMTTSHCKKGRVGVEYTRTAVG